MNIWNPVEPREADSPKAGEQGEFARASRHILVVDDDGGIRKMLARVLRGAGYRVSCAEDGQAGWEAFCAEEFDALITDHDMPRLTGVGLLRRVRTVSRQMPVILISGLMPVGEGDLPQLLSPGLALEKPFTLDDLFAGVRAVLTPGAPVNELGDELLRPADGGQAAAVTRRRDAVMA